MADKQARRTEEVLKTFKDTGDTWAEVIVAINADGTPIGGGGGETSGLTDAELRATPVPVTGDFASDGLTDVELRATPVPVSGPLTDTQLRATPVPVSGTVATGALTDTQLRATAVPTSNTTITALAKAEDAAHVSGDMGIQMLAVRTDVVAARAGTDGDYIPLTTDATGALWVRITNGAGVQSEDGAATSGFSGVASLAVRRDAEATTVSADGDFAEVQVDSVGRVKVNNKITDAAIAVPSDIQAVYRVQSILTSTVLAGAAVYTSAGVDGLNFRRITGRVIASHDGVLHVEHSDDNATWDSVDPLTVVATTGYGFDVPIFARYVRLRYVNGATLQTSFRLSGYLAAA